MPGWEAGLDGCWALSVTTCCIIAPQPFCSVASCCALSPLNMPEVTATTHRNTCCGLIGHRMVCLNLFGHPPCSSSVCSAARPDKLRRAHASFFVFWSCRSAMPPKKRATLGAVAKKPAAPGYFMKKGASTDAVAREARVERANERLHKRRAALRSLNALVAQTGYPSLKVDVRQPAIQSVNKLFRFFARRGLDGRATTVCTDAVKLYTQNGGTLPEGMSLCDGWGGLGVAPDASPAVPRHKVFQSSYRLHSRAFMLTYNSTSFTPGTWGEFHKFAKSFARQHGARAWAACLEESLHACAVSGAPDGKRYHTHAYFVWTDEVGVWFSSLDALRFGDVRPRVDVCKGNGSAATAGQPCKAALHGLWYVTVVKAGTLHSATDYFPWQHYTPNMSWLCGLYDAKKLSHGEFLKLSAEFRTGHAQRKRNVDEPQKQELEAAVDEHVALELAALQAKDPLRTFHSFAEITEFIDCFKEPRWRRPILLIVGGTNHGKSLLAAHVLREIAQVVGTPSFLEVTVEDDAELDMSQYDHRLHSGVLLDGVADTLTLWRKRETLQGRPKKIRGGKSSTMMYSYPYTLARRAIVVTMDLTAKNLHLLHTNHWSKEPRNILRVTLASPSWVGAAPASGASPTSQATMSAWSVCEVEGFYNSHDAAGIAAVFAQNAVDGSDLLAFVEPRELVCDLRMTAFAAKKALRLRDGFLGA